MTLHLLDHIFFALIALVLPIVDSFSMRKRGALIRAGRTELRMPLYRKLIREEWIAVLVMFALWFGLGRSAASLGLVLETGFFVWAGYGLTVLLCALLFVQMRIATASEKNRAAFREQMGDLAFMTPRTDTERRTFNLLSLTAGICEELVFRGFAIAYLTSLLGVSIWVAALLSSIAFGFAHMYQGPLGMLRTGFVGLVLAVLFVMTGSLWAPMIAHAVMDILAGRMSYEAFTDHTPGDSTPELAA